MRCNLAAAILICTLACAEDKLDKLNVVALDPDGQPALGLQSTDFQLFKDGKPQKIAFSRFTGGKPLQTARPPQNEYSNRGAGLPATVVVIDLLSDRLMSASIINNDVARAVKDLESSEGLYLYILTARGDLYPVHPLPKADTEIAPAEEPWTRNITPMLQTALKDVFGFRPIDDNDIVIRFESTARALRALGAQMKLISGRKNLIWVTHGIPLYGPSISEQGRIDMTIPVRLLCEQLERAQIVVYPVEQSMRGAAAALATESNQTLEEFANLTGGRLYRSGGVGSALQHAMTDSRANYQLAYYAEPQNPDGKHRKLRVSCTRKGVRLLAEEGFHAVLPPIRSGDLERANLEIASHSPFDATEIGLRAIVSSDLEAKRNVRLDIRIDPSDLLLHPAQDRRTGNIALLFAVYAANGFEQSSPLMPREVNLTPAQYETAARDGIPFREAISIGETIRRVRVIVVDRELGSVGSVTVPVQR